MGSGFASAEVENGLYLSHAYAMHPPDIHESVHGVFVSAASAAVDESEAGGAPNVLGLSKPVSRVSRVVFTGLASTPSGSVSGCNTAGVFATLSEPKRKFSMPEIPFETVVLTVSTRPELPVSEDGGGTNAENGCGFGVRGFESKRACSNSEGPLTEASAGGGGGVRGAAVSGFRVTASASGANLTDLPSQSVVA
jgi:hypothetical protein